MIRHAKGVLSNSWLTRNQRAISLGGSRSKIAHRAGSKLTQFQSATSKRSTTFRLFLVYGIMHPEQDGIRPPAETHCLSTEIGFTRYGSTATLHRSASNNTCGSVPHRLSCSLRARTPFAPALMVRLGYLRVALPLGFHFFRCKSRGASALI